MPIWFYCIDWIGIMVARQNKYIDLTQFPHNDNGTISWKDSVGVIVEFFYNDIKHELEILERINKDNFKIRVDDIIINKARTNKITELMFDNIFYKPDYSYNAGDVVNNAVVIEQTVIAKKGSVAGTKAYKLECLNDGYEFVMAEYDLKHNHGCPLCANKIVVKGINDIATTEPDLVKLFYNEEDAYTHSRKSDDKVVVVCPNCGYKKMMRIADLTKLGHVSCDMCSDGVSYPNKFAHELFRQLNGQYIIYKCEYSPEWSKPYVYDNYVELLNGEKIIVEMDGHYHYMNGKLKYGNDSVKNELCVKNGINIIRIDCNYKHQEDRFDYIKLNVIKKLEPYFNLKYIDWDKCDLAGISSYIKIAADKYNNNPFMSIKDISCLLNVNVETIYKYLRIADRLGLCKYDGRNQNRISSSNPIAMYNAIGDVVGVFNSCRIIVELFPECNFTEETLRQHVCNGMPYNGYVFKRVS